MRPAFLKGIKLERHELADLLAADLAGVESVMERSLRSEVPYIQELNEGVLDSQGKRLRPALLILAAGRPGESGDDVLLCAAVVEMIHAASLLHDDVVDRGLRRRGRPTLNAEHGDGPAILMGDYVYTRALTLLVDAGLMEVFGLLARAVHRLSVGELLQLELKQRRILDEDAYRRVIYEKTARLIEATCRAGGILGGRPAGEVETLAAFGRELGMAFQIVDDMLDYDADALRLGKPVGRDLAEGKRTLPLLKAWAAAPPDRRDRLAELLGDGGENRLAIIELVRDLGGLEAAHAEAVRYGERSRRALADLPASPVRAALDASVDFVVARRF